MPVSYVFKSVGSGRIVVPLTPSQAIQKPAVKQKAINVRETVKDVQVLAEKWAGSANSLFRPTKVPAKSLTPRWKRVLRMAGINANTTGTHTIVPGVFGENIYLSHITFTVGGEVNITFYDGSFPMTGPMDFGGADEPRGAVMDHGKSPILCALNESFSIAIDANKQISGYVTYYSLPGIEE